MAKRHYRITLADALSAHDRALTFGGLGGIANLGSVESAIARPYSGYYRKIEEKSAALVQSMAGNHGFTDGNKRTTLILVITVISNSNYELRGLPGEDIEAAAEEMVLKSVTHEMSYTDLVVWFRARILRAQ